MGVGGADGVVVNTAASVDVGRAEISGFSGDGITFNGGSRLTMRDSIVRGNAQVRARVRSARHRVPAIEGSSFDSNNVGVHVDGSATASLRGVSLTENPSRRHHRLGRRRVGGFRHSRRSDADEQWLRRNQDRRRRIDAAGRALRSPRLRLSPTPRTLAHCCRSSIVQATGLPERRGRPGAGNGTTAEVERSSMSYFILGFDANASGTMRVFLEHCHGRPV